jgi:hypothetical protein
MNLRNIFKFGKREAAPEPKQVFNSPVSSFSMSAIDLPQIAENKTREWVNYGTDNLYPKRLMQYLETSAIHSAIVQQKSELMSGKKMSFVTDGLTPNQVYAAKKLIDSPNEMETAQDINEKLAFDFQVFGAFAVIVTWSLDFSTIARVEHCDIINLRSGKYVDGRVTEYYYSRDWSKIKQNPPTRIAAFDTENKTDYQQVIYLGNKRPGYEYYGIPHYISAISWLQIDGELSQFHLSNISQGFQPGFSLNFFTKPNSREEKEEIVNNIKKQYGGTKNSGKVMVFFSEGKDLAPEVNPIPVQNLDKQFIALGELITQNIISAHRVTSPALLGIATPGKLGYSNELEVSFNIFDTTVIAPDRALLKRMWAKLFRLNGVDTEVQIEKINPLVEND